MCYTRAFLEGLVRSALDSDDFKDYVEKELDRQ